MLYAHKNIQGLEELLEKLKKQSFSIETQYKFLKINKTLKEERDLFAEQSLYLLSNYAEKDENGQIITKEDGGIKIKEDKLKECASKVQEINNMEVQFPDIYFSLDELEPLGLTLKELELLEPFIK